MSEITVHDTVAREAIEAPHDRLIDTVTGTQQNALEGVEAARIALVEGAVARDDNLLDVVPTHMLPGSEAFAAGDVGDTLRL